MRKDVSTTTEQENSAGRRFLSLRLESRQPLGICVPSWLWGKVSDLERHSISKGFYTDTRHGHARIRRPGRFNSLSPVGGLDVPSAGNVRPG